MTESIKEQLENQPPLRIETEISITTLLACKYMYIIKRYLKYLYVIMTSATVGLTILLVCCYCGGDRRRN